MKHNLRITRKPLDQLRQHPKNPRNGDIELIAESLATNGQYKPIVVTKDGTILAGNHTYAAALSLGWKDILAVALDLDPASPEAERIMLADNRTSDVGNYDDSALAELLEGLEAVGDLTGTGYNSFDLDRILAELATPPVIDLGDPDTNGGEQTGTDMLQWGFVQWKQTRVRLMAREVFALDVLFANYFDENGSEAGFGDFLIADRVPEEDVDHQSERLEVRWGRVKSDREQGSAEKIADAGL